MEIQVNTGLEEFCLIDSITEINNKHIEATVNYESSDFFLVVETMAQVSAYHNRYKNEFEKHSFLLKIKDFTGKYQQSTTGSYRVISTEKAFTDRASTYSVEVYDSENKVFSSEIIIASSEYSDNFPRDKIQKYYMDKFKCLKINGLEN